jgi:hypothetical protein
MGKPFFFYKGAPKDCFTPQASGDSSASNTVYRAFRQSTATRFGSTSWTDTIASMEVKILIRLNFQTYSN